MVGKLLIGLALAIAGSAVSAQAQGGGPASVFAQPVEMRDFSMQIEALGTLEPNEMVELSLNAADRVTAVFFDDGQRVEAGRTLLSLAQREQVALVESAEATLEEARRQLERVSRLAEAEAVSQSELDQAQRNLDSAGAQVRAVQSRQRDRVLVAPFDGVLGFRRVSVGTYLRPGDLVATLIDDSQMRLEFAIPSTFLRALKTGTEITVTTDDLPGERFDGTITTIDNAIDPITRSIRVRATLPNPDRVLKSGMFMQVTLVADPRTAMAIPQEAIQPIGPKSFVFRLRDEGSDKIAQRTEVQIGMRQAGHVEILSGLEAGDPVVTEGLIRVRDGAKVVIRDKSILQPRPSVASTGKASNAVSTGQ